MKTKSYMFIYILTALFFIYEIASPASVEAVPAFARQTGTPCLGCHFQSFPTLNAAGRAFKAGGYVDSGQENVEGDDLSIPPNLNMSMIMKVRRVQKNGDSNKGNEAGGLFGGTEWPDEAAFIPAGRIGEKVGFLAEIGLGGEVEVETESDCGSHTHDATGDTGSVHVECAGEGGGGSLTLLSSRIHFVAADFGDIQLNVIPFSTDAAGVAYGLELMNTGAQKSQRPIEERTSFSAVNKLKLYGAATGIAFAATGSNFMASYTMWSPTFWGSAKETNGAASYIRAEYFMDVAGFDMGMGIQSYGGSYKTAQGTSNGVKNADLEIETTATVLDFQAQGEVADMSLGFYFSNATVPNSEKNMYNHTDGNGAKTATGLLAKLGVTPKVEAFVAMMQSNNGAEEKNTDNEMTFGAMYKPIQNIRFEISSTSYSGSKFDGNGDGGVGTTKPTAKNNIQLFTAF